MSGDERLDRARGCYARRAWREAWALLSACDSESGLDDADLERLAVAAVLVAEDQATDSLGVAIGVVMSNLG